MSQERDHASRILYEYKQAQMNPYAWVLLCLGWVLMASLALALLGLPVYLAVDIHWLWAAAALICMPAGILFFLVLIKKARKHLIRNRYPEHYQLKADGLIFTRRNRRTGKLERRKHVDYTQADYAVISIHAFIGYEEREAGKLTEAQFRERVYPALHFIVSRDGQRRHDSMKVPGRERSEDLKLAPRGYSGNEGEGSLFVQSDVISVPIMDPMSLPGLLEALIERRLPLYLAPASVLPGKESSLFQWKVGGMLFRLEENQPFYTTFYELFIETRFKYRKAYRHVQTRLTDTGPENLPAAGKSSRSTFPFTLVSAGFLSLLLLGELGFLQRTSLWTGWLVLVPAFLAYSAAAKPDLRRPVVFAALCMLIAGAVMAGGHYLLGLGREPVILETLMSVAVFLPVSYPLYLIVLLLKKRSSMHSRRTRAPGV
ncbi:hypothetical protein [Paenibacillus senegalensis]|uniref:hypothetical protein n=1 Tax=Paenibacillus senegalensis TaxID=1465766 RepID=UPI000289930B|nr:hypothetical protein [Paenibacillus senegalensis]